MGLVAGVTVPLGVGGAASPLHLLAFPGQVASVLSGLRALAGLLRGVSGLITGLSSLAALGKAVGSTSEMGTFLFSLHFWVFGDKQQHC